MYQDGRSTGPAMVLYTRGQYRWAMDIKGVSMDRTGGFIIGVSVDRTGRLQILVLCL